MADVTFKGDRVATNGYLPGEGSHAPSFRLTGADLSEVGLGDFAGKKKILTINPSLDTGVCRITAKNFNRRAGELDDTVVVVITGDLPFAQKRFAEAENADDVVYLSMLRDRSFAEDYGILLTSGPLAGLPARAVLVLDRDDQVVYSELVPEIAEEPDYEAALRAAEQA